MKTQRVSLSMKSFLIVAIALTPLLALIARAEDDRSAFTKAIASSRIFGFMEILRNSGIPEETVSAEDVTMIIPVDTSFYTLAPEKYRALLAPENKELAARYIRAHVIKGHFTVEQLAAGGVKTLGGVEIKATLGKGPGANAATINGRRVVMADQAGKPGAFHLIDGFLFQP